MARGREAVLAASELFGVGVCCPKTVRDPQQGCKPQVLPVQSPKVKPGRRGAGPAAHLQPERSPQMSMKTFTSAFIRIFILFIYFFYIYQLKATSSGRGSRKGLPAGPTAPGSHHQTRCSSLLHREPDLCHLVRVLRAAGAAQTAPGHGVFSASAFTPIRGNKTSLRGKTAAGGRRGLGDAVLAVTFGHFLFLPPAFRGPC